MSKYNSQKHKVDYAIISAMPEELNLFMEEFSNVNCSEVKIGELNFKIYNYQNANILVTFTGMGTTCASSILTLIHSHFQPDYFLVSGTAGGIKEGLKMKDVVVAEEAFEAEIQGIFTVLKGTRFESALKHPIKNKYLLRSYPADPDLLAICNSLELKNIDFHRGMVVSSNVFPAPKELFEKIKCFDPYSIDMETSAFYQTAWLLNAKILAVRGISNVLNPDGTDENIDDADIEGSSLTSATVILSILKKLIFLKKHDALALSDKLEDEALQLIKEYDLCPHPEGGYFSSSYKSSDEVMSIDQNRYNNENRQASTAIYYLLNKHDHSAWHSLNSDELWHFYRGSAINIYVIDKEGKLHTHLLGDFLETKGASFQVVIKAGDFFAAENVDKNTYGLVGCTVSPGFEYSDFHLAEKDMLIKKFPQHQEIIERLSYRPGSEVSRQDEGQKNHEASRKFSP